MQRQTKTKKIMTAFEKMCLQHTKNNLFFMLENVTDIELLKIRNIATLLIHEIENAINTDVKKLHNENRAEK